MVEHAIDNRAAGRSSRPAWTKMRPWPSVSGAPLLKESTLVRVQPAVPSVLASLYLGVDTDLISRRSRFESVGRHQVSGSLTPEEVYLTFNQNAVSSNLTRPTKFSWSRARVDECPDFQSGESGIVTHRLYQII